MPRGVYLLGLGLALVALALSFTDWALSLRPGVTEANARHIRAGMILPEVEALLGGPGTPVRDGSMVIPGGTPLPPPAGYVWFGGAGLAGVGTGDDGRVQWASWQPVAQAGPLARLRSWLGR
jgi:hypothetical protein